MNLRTMSRTAAALLLALALLTAGCAANAPITEENPPPISAIPEPEPLPEPEPEPEPVLPYTYPLTGVPAAELLTERPIVVMVENSPAARPQTGLHEADLVYEVLAEGDITRFIAVYHSRGSEEIGPVRSIRPYMVELGRAVDGILVHAGWSQEAMNLMTKHKLNHLDQVYGDHDYYWRDNSRKAPHNLYTSTELIRKGAAAKKFRTEWSAPALAFTAAEEAMTGTEDAKSVQIPYLAGYDVGYTYDEESGAYLRVMEGKPHTDKKTDTRLSAANVLIVEAPHRIVDNVGRREVGVFGPGDGYLLQRGKKRDVTWEMKDGLIRAFAAAGDAEPIPFVPGTTWVQIVPDAEKVTFE